MSAFRSVEIDCDNCGRTSTTAAVVDAGPWASARELRVFLAAQGWEYRVGRRRVDLCPGCASV